MTTTAAATQKLALSPSEKATPVSWKGIFISINPSKLRADLAQAAGVLASTSRDPVLSTRTSFLCSSEVCNCSQIQPCCEAVLLGQSVLFPYRFRDKVSDN